MKACSDTTYRSLEFTFALKLRLDLYTFLLLPTIMVTIRVTSDSRSKPEIH